MKLRTCPSGHIKIIQKGGAGMGKLQEANRVFNARYSNKQPYDFSPLI